MRTEKGEWRTGDDGILAGGVLMLQVGSHDVVKRHGGIGFHVGSATQHRTRMLEIRSALETLANHVVHLLHPLLVEGASISSNG